MAPTVLNSPRAVEVSLYVVRTSVRLREALSANKDLAGELAELEKKTEAPALKHNALASNTRMQPHQVFEAIRELMSAPEPARRRPIGFVTEDTKKRGERRRTNGCFAPGRQGRDRPQPAARCYV